MKSTKRTISKWSIGMYKVLLKVIWLPGHVISTQTSLIILKMKNFSSIPCLLMPLRKRSRIMKSSKSFWKTWEFQALPPTQTKLTMHTSKSLRKNLRYSKNILKIGMLKSSMAMTWSIGKLSKKHWSALKKARLVSKTFWLMISKWRWCKDKKNQMTWTPKKIKQCMINNIKISVINLSLY